MEMFSQALRLIATGSRWRFTQLRLEHMKKFIIKRADDLEPGDVVTMANVLEIKVRSVKRVGQTMLVRDESGILYAWADSYQLHVINPWHPAHPDK